MDSLTCTAVFAVLLCASGVLGQPGTTGQACATTGNPCTATTDICDSNFCKRKVDATCASPNQANCVLGAQCDVTTSTCKCRPTVYAVGTGDNVGKCTPTPNYAGGSCSGTDKGSCLDVNAVCTSGTCTCKAAFSRNTDTNTCSDGTTGQGCNTGNVCAATTDICDSNICKRKVDATCSSPNQANCVLGAQCDGTTTTCKCRPTVYAVGTGDNVGKCIPAQNYAGGPCSGTDKGSCLDVNAVCNNTVCTCKAAYPRNYDTNTCSACSGLTFSVTLMLLGLIVTSRFL